MSAQSKEFLAVLHVFFKDEDEIAAIASADDIKLRLENDVLIEEGEGVDVVQVIPATEDPAPEASVIQLRRARNILIRTRDKEAWEFARALDPMIDGMQARILGPMGNAKYDWGKFLKVTKEIVDGGNPLEY